MGWGIRRQPQQQAAAAAERGGGGKGKAAAFSFSPLSWIAKLTARSSHGKCGGAKHAPAASMAGPSCRLPKRAAAAAASSSSVVAAVDDVAAGRSSPPRRSPVDVAPRRLSVGNDSAEAVARRLCQQQRRRRRHCSLGGDRDLPPLGHLIPFSLAGSPASQPPENAAAAAAGGATPSDTDAGAKLRTRRHRRRAHRRRRSSLGGSGRRSFSVSGRMPAVRIRPPRAAASAPELERLAVVRRTRDPQRAFRESMVEMIASSGGSIAARPEELERLLACYLALNADEHHDCIVKVFRQVWFEYINLHLHLSRRRRARHC
ncbi:uncharacterized protein [Oryza sativa Japonica Group]|uniref:Transcription repressor n=2 Tax=Oryza TaxID=4527 RepID=A0A0N7KL33_ORYSJ|nr:serine/arginine repetitive matrix protein 3 [Oryza sativa Japonica Group]KAB8100194.1 hypothetical protein EE612_030639 [Oryza sativa]KAF2931651.1 hypothetical protein DAI22_05g227500 [Oryza sativa Japonica Group]BAS94897.1 Os05g0517100 [Oryza sativa Japonica Group]